MTVVDEEIKESPSGRRTRKRNTSYIEKKMQPSSSMYVGYVMDEESIESIMKKFQAVDQFKQQIQDKGSDNNEGSADDENVDSRSCNLSSNQEKNTTSARSTTGEEGNNVGENNLTQEQLEEIFKRTSMFSAKSMTQSLDFDVSECDDGEEWKEQLYLRDRDCPSEEEEVSWSQDEELWYVEPKVRKRSARTPKEKKAKRVRPTNKLLLQVQAGTRVAIKKKARVIDPRKPTYIRVPETPMPKSWCPTIKPYQVKDNTTLPSCTSYEEHDLHSDKVLGNMKEAIGDDKYMCIYMDPPLVSKQDETNGDGITINDLKKMNLGSFVEAGFIFIWLEKEFIPDIFTLMKEWDFRYVENICWFFKNINNRIAKIDSPFLKRSKLTCLIFRKQNADIELRHQRNCDVLLDYVQPEDWEERKVYRKQHRPEYVYTSIETLLPDARCPCNPETNTPRIHVGKCLELWAKPNTHREGWFSVAHKPN